MAPRVANSRNAEPAAAPEKVGSDASGPMLSQPRNAQESAIAALRKKVEATSDYVGSDFARQARDIHEGRAPERSIYGEARPDQARRLMAAGVPLLPLPFRPKKSTQ